MVQKHRSGSSVALKICNKLFHNCVIKFLPVLMLKAQFLDQYDKEA
jgi:hypothetical protein